MEKKGYNISLQSITDGATIKNGSSGADIMYQVFIGYYDGIVLTET